MLNEQQLMDISVLQELCEKEDAIQLKLNWEMLKARKENRKMDFLDYEGSTLIGFLAIYGFGNKYEICGMVHPEKRQQGIFTSLFQEALEKIPDSAKVILINAPAKSYAAKQWLQTKTFDYSFSEYQMKWEPIRLELSAKIVQLREASSADTETRIQLDVTGFGFDEAEAREFNLHQTENDNESYICGFAVFPKLQGKGYGRNALTQMVLAETELDRVILLEVAAENKHALKLYEECGFHSYEVQDYYQFNKG